MNLKYFIIHVWVFICNIEHLHGQVCHGVISDPFWGQEWYLNKSHQERFDLNVIPAWRNCINGSGVTVGVLSSGIDDHTDLSINRHVSVSNRLDETLWSWMRRIWRGYNINIDKSTLRVGTRMAGIIGGRKNNIGVVGVAYGATIADINVGGTSVLETFNASLLRHRSDIIDIYCSSFTHFHTGTRTYPLTLDQEMALHYGTTMGRNGLGSVYVFPSGNNGGEEDNIFRDSCAYDRLISNRYVITVAGIQYNMAKRPSGEECSAIMVSGFTATPGHSDHRVWTTDINNQYTRNFVQNSAAAAMVSGAIALALQTNPSLTYRDIMHLIVMTARTDHENFDQSKFITNAANLRVSSTFGFGLLDVDNLVTRSLQWVNVPKSQRCTTHTLYNNLPINHNDIVFEVRGCAAQYTEHVEVSLKVKHDTAGLVRWILISPYGTRSTIIPGRGLDTSKSMDITVLTVQMWGENPNGYWRLEALPVFGTSLDYGVLESASLIIHGYRCRNGECLNEANQATWGGWAEWSSCDCRRGIRTRLRQCNRVTPADYCYGESVETQHCNIMNCQTNIGIITWLPWSEWSQCPSACTDNDLQLRSRQCSLPNGCHGNSFDTRPCPPCQDRKGTARWSAWSEWSRCPLSLWCTGNRIQIRTRVCSRPNGCLGDSVDSRPCSSCLRPSVPDWLPWSEWSGCPSQCNDNSIQIRSRICSQRYGCQGNPTDARPCPPCPATDQRSFDPTTHYPFIPVTTNQRPISNWTSTQRVFSHATTDRQPFRDVTTDRQSFPDVTTDLQPFPDVTSDRQPFPDVTTDLQPFPDVTSDRQPFHDVTTDRQSFPDVTTDLQSFSDVTSDRQSFPDVTSDRQSFPDVSSDRQSFPDVTTDRQSFPDVTTDLQPFPDVSSDRLSFPDVTTDRQSFPDVTTDLQPFPDVSSDRQSFPDVTTDRQSFPDVTTDLQPFPDVSSDRQSFPDVTTDRQSFPDVTTDLQPFPDVSSDRQSFPDVSSDRQPFRDVTTDRQSFPGVTTDLQPFPDVTSDRQSFPDVTSDRQSFPAVTTDHQPFSNRTTNHSPTSHETTNGQEGTARWSAWSEWSRCPLSLWCTGNRIQIRTRVCSRPNGCLGDSVDSRPCSSCLRPSVPDWLPWSEWSGCPSQCNDNSIQIRSRICSQRYGCQGNPTDARPCPPCPATDQRSFDPTTHYPFIPVTTNQRPISNWTSTPRVFSHATTDHQPFRDVTTDRQSFPDVTTDLQPFPDVTSDRQPFPDVTTDLQPFPDVSSDRQSFPDVSSDRQPFRDVTTDRQSFPGVTTDLQPFPDVTSDRQSFPDVTSDRQSFPAVTTDHQPFSNRTTNHSPTSHETTNGQGKQTTQATYHQEPSQRTPEPFIPS